MSELFKNKTENAPLMEAEEKKYDNAVMQRNKQPEQPQEIQRDEFIQMDNSEILDETIERVNENMPPLYSREYAKDLFKEVRLLAEDKGKASEFFAPVVAAAKELMSEEKDEEKKATSFAHLLGRALYYLNKRSSSMFSGQRNRRRAACERLIEKAGAFLADAPAVYSDALKDTISDLKESDKKKEEGNALSQKFGYFISDEYISAKDAEDKLNELEEDMIPAEVRKILDTLEGVRSTEKLPMPVHPGKKAQKAEIDRFQKEVFEGGIAVTRMYDILLERCNDYLKANDPYDWISLQVTSIKERTEHIRKIFSNSISDFIEGNITDGRTTWADALSAKSGQLMQLNSEETQKLGDGTSVVYKMKKDGKTVFFKSDDKMADDCVDAWTMTREAAKNMKGYKESFEEELNKIDVMMTEAYSEYTESKRKKNEDYADMAEQYFYDNFIAPLIPYAGRELARGIRNNRHGRYSFAVLPHLLTYEKTDPEFHEFIMNVFSDYVKKFNAYYFATHTVGIKAGKVISDRNVLTSRMAQLMNIGHLVTKSETADVMQGEKKVTGIVMEEAKGKEALECYKDKTKKTKYTDQTVSDILTMQVFDIILGQVDRNVRNYFFTKKDGKLSGLKMIDNDMCGGVVPAELMFKGYQAMPKMERALLISLPLEIRNKIHEMATYPPEYFTLVFGDIMDKREIKNIINRIKYVDKEIKKEEKKLKDNKNKSDEDAFIADMMEKNDPVFGALYFQKKMLENAIEKAKKDNEDYDKMTEAEKDEEFKEYVADHSYMSYYMLLPLKEVNERIAEYRSKWKK